MGSKNGKPILREEDIEALSKSSGMEAEQVKQAFDSFVSEHPNGKMKPADFKKMMTAAMPKKDAGKMEKYKDIYCKEIKIQPTFFLDTSSGSMTPIMTVKVLIFSIWRKFTHKTICLGYIDFVEFMVIFHVMSDGTSEEVKSKNGKKFQISKTGVEGSGKDFPVVRCEQ